MASSGRSCSPTRSRRSIHVVRSSPSHRPRTTSSCGSAGLRAHNRWLADWCAEYPGRRAGIGQILLNDVDEAVRDVHWIADHGLRGGVLLPGVPPDAPHPAAARTPVRPGVARLRGARRERERTRRQQLTRLRRAPGVALDVDRRDGLVLAPPAVDVHPGRGVRPLPGAPPRARRAGECLDPGRARRDGQLLRADRAGQRRRDAVRGPPAARAHAERVLAEQLHGRGLLPPSRGLRPPRPHRCRPHHVGRRLSPPGGHDAVLARGHPHDLRRAARGRGAGDAGGERRRGLRLRPGGARPAGRTVRADGSTT